MCNFEVLKINEIRDMFQSRIAGIGYYVPKNVYTNDDLTRFMDTSDEWIQERTGIKERRYADRLGETTTTMAIEASKIAIERAGTTAAEIDFIIFATLSPDYYFPGCGVLLQREMGMKEVGALDIRNQCSGFVYALSVADQFIKTGMYKNILVVGSEKQSFAMDFATRSRSVSVIFGDGAGAVVLQPTQEHGKGILSTHLHADGADAEKLAMYYPGASAGIWLDNPPKWPEQELGGLYMTKEMLEDGSTSAYMDGQAVFKKAVVKFPEVIQEALAKNSLVTSDIDMLIPHQANLRISQFVQKSLGLADHQVFNNIQKYGNTTAASVPIALCEAWEEGKIKEGDLICLAAFGAGFTWGSALIRW
ncbi:3-oxoacyl-ACP synthase III family protein [Sphingobacterium sp. SYP-B4668]|uniref:3-oxoacyl-ACP synthase III family protein n=1 Tax=Sphingobacterium sp. SYP-B4668 TaxID=2996035 RepID=UPI0022DDED86|nr:beta-ketoacyl-ACP synthase III [Sphingobacterium sp. SYP-B4668]